MSLTRARALRSVQSVLSKGAPRVSAPRTQLVAKRFASGGHGGHAPPGSDIPWLISALVVTPVSCWYLWPETKTDSHHGHGHGHDDHAEHEDAHEKEEADEKDEQPAEEVAEKNDEPASEPAEEKTEEKSETMEGEESSEDAAGDDEGEESGDNKRGTTGKNKIRSDSEGASVTRKVESGSKGTNKVRLDSGLGKNLGEGINSDTAFNKSEGSETKSSVTSKQAGLSNTDTRHSLQVDAPESEISTKGDGSPETAKHKGTVDPNAPVK